jgi:hypothetical protein
MLATASPPGLAEATKNSTATWQTHLEQLFHNAKDRFPDVVWDLTTDDDDDNERVLGEVWGHKGSSLSLSLSAHPGAYMH